MKRFLLITIAFFAISNIVKAQDDRELTEAKWILKSVDGKEIEYQNNEAKKAYVIFEEDELRASGYSGCNGFSVSYYLSGDILKFDNLLATMRACVGNDIEGIFLPVFSRTDACLIIGNKLILMQMGEEIATFEGEDLDEE